MRAGTLAALLLCGCGRDAAHRIPVTLPEAAAVFPVPADAITITVTATGEIYRAGEKTTLESLPEAQRDESGIRRNPIVIEADAALKVGDITALIGKMISSGRCAKISFATRHAREMSTVPLCVPISYSPPGLRYFDGPNDVNQLGEIGNRTFVEPQHLWILVRPDPLRVEQMTVCGWTRFSRVPWGRTPAKDDGSAAVEPWPGERPPYGDWTLDMLRRFLARTEVVAASPALVLFPEKDDALATTLKLAADLRQFRVQVMLFLPWWDRGK
ncbi:MAG: hypothetical protein IT452_11240 [Planctomycetia bacterium]|nr:hypothetical protein [Planctomycetia bacterium]